MTYDSIQGKFLRYPFSVLECPDFGSERPDLKSERSNLGSERPEMRSERPDLGSKGLHFEAWVRGNRRKTETGKFVLYGIIGHRPLRGRCPKERRKKKKDEKQTRDFDT